jgi:adenylate kinase family enzyme
MVKKVFVLGLPGSGKSTAGRYIEQFAKNHGWIPRRFNDYDILYKMFQADTEGRQFSSTQHGGFDVHDHIAFDDALKELKRRVLDTVEAAAGEKDKLIIIEFARNDYCRALEMFSPEFLQDTLFLFIDADIPTCKQRIRERIAHPSTRDDHYVSEYIFEAYYQLDNRQYLKSVVSQLKTFCAIDEKKIQVIDNTCSDSILAFLESIELFSLSIFGASLPVQKPASAIISPDELPTTHDSYHEDLPVTEHTLSKS